MPTVTIDPPGPPVLNAGRSKDRNLSVVGVDRVLVLGINIWWASETQICRAVYRCLFWSNMRIGIILILKSGNGEVHICTFVIIRPLYG